MKKQRLSAAMTALITALICILVSAGGLVFYTTTVRSAEFQVQATAFAKDFLISQARSIQQANLQATIQATATANALQDLYSQSISNSPLIYNDPLNEKNNVDWEQTTNPVGSCLFNNGSYHAEILNTYGIQPCLNQSSTLTNFAFQVRMTIIKGVADGIVFRYSGATGSTINAYLFDVTPANDGYALFSLQNGQIPTFTNGFSPAINTSPNQPNLLTVIAKGSNLYLYVNSQFVDSVSNNNFTSGEAGVFAFGNVGTTDVAFNNAQIWKL